MKPSITVQRIGSVQRECLPFRDMTDCLLQAYDCVARRAYQIFLGRGGNPGGELDDWLNAERELLGNLPVNLEDGGESFSALASLPGLSSAQVDVGIDPRWLVILGHHHRACEFGEQDERDTDFDQVAAWVSTIHADSRTLRVNCRGAKPSVSSPGQHVPARLPPSLANNSAPAHVTNGAGAVPKRDSTNPRPVDHHDELPETRRPTQPAHARKARPAASFEGGPEQYADGIASQLFCVLELPSEIDPVRCVAVLANGLLGIRMPKRKSSAH